MGSVAIHPFSRGVGIGTTPPRSRARSRVRPMAVKSVAPLRPLMQKNTAVKSSRPDTRAVKRKRKPRPSQAIQCRGLTKKGVGCKMRTKRGDLCWMHLKSQEKLRIKKSNIANAGLGLYTMNKIKKKKKITDYGGNVTTAPTNSGYEVQLRTRPPAYMDGSNPTSSFGRFANTCRQPNKDAGQCRGNNAKLAISQRNNRWKVNLKATKNIKPGDEVFLAYGAGYQIPPVKGAKKKRRRKKRN
jgi:hypothetical protein